MFISGGWNKLGIVLSPPFGCEKVVITATPAFRVFTAYCGAGVIDCALPFICVQKLADFSEDMVFLMS